MPLIRKPAAAAAALPAAFADTAGLLTAANPDERWTAARLLSNGPENASLLAAALAGEDDARVREAILTGLVRHPGEAAVAAILPLIRSDEASVRTAALDALRAMPALLGARLGEVLSDADPDVRLLACDLARVLSSSEASLLLGDLLDRESHTNVLAAALDALLEVGGPEALPAIRRCADRATEPFVVFAARVAADRISGGATGDRG